MREDPWGTVEEDLPPEAYLDDEGEAPAPAQEPPVEAPAESMPVDEPPAEDEPPIGEPPEDEYGPEAPAHDVGGYDVRDAEVLVIGAALASDGEAVERMDVLGTDFVRYPALGAVWDAIRERHQASDPVDVAGLATAFPDRLMIIYASTDHALTWHTLAEHWATLVLGRAQRTRLREQVQAALDGLDTEPLATTAGALRESAAEAEARAPRKALVYTRTLVRERLDEPEDHGVQYPTPWRALNGIIGGFRPGGLYVVGARPGVGKSVIALQAAHALSQTGKVAFSTLEMSRSEVTNRLIAQQCQIPYALLSTPGKGLSDFMLDRMAVFAATDPGNIAVDDGSRRTVLDVRQHARDVARDGELRAVVVDYLQLLSGTGGKGVPRHEQVADMSRTLKILAGELQVPVIALSQLNRDSAKANAVPRLSDLRESGAIEQDADVVILLHRDRDSPQPSEVMDLLVAKNRQGEERSTQLHWQGAFVRCMDMA